MHKAIAFSLLTFAAALGVACGNSYHPEYHPVSVNQVEQNLAYPVTVQTGSQPAPVYVNPPQGYGAPATPAPAAQAPAAPPQGPANGWYDPSDFFSR